MASPLTGRAGLIPPMKLQERLAEVMRVMGWTESELVGVSGASRSAVAQWLGKGSKEIHTIKAEYASAIQQKSGFSAAWVAAGKGPKMAEKIIPQQDMEAEQTVLYVAMLALLTSHPDPAALLVSFDGVVSGMNARGELRESVLLGLQRLRSQLVLQAEAKKRTSPR